MNIRIPLFAIFRYPKMTLRLLRCRVMGHKLRRNHRISELCSDLHTCSRCNTGIVLPWGNSIDA